MNSYSPSTQVSKKKRQLSGTNDYGDGEDSDADEEDAGLGALGYMTTKQFSGLGIEAKASHVDNLSDNTYLCVFFPFLFRCRSSHNLFWSLFLPPLSLTYLVTRKNGLPHENILPGHRGVHNSSALSKYSLFGHTQVSPIPFSCLRIKYDLFCEANFFLFRRCSGTEFF